MTMKYVQKLPNCPKCNAKLKLISNRNEAVYDACLDKGCSLAWTGWCKFGHVGATHPADCIGYILCEKCNYRRCPIDPQEFLEEARE
jgi:hypothetical protein